MLPRKRQCPESSGSSIKVAKSDSLLDGVSSVEDALSLLMDEFPVLPHRFPPIVWKHQLYAFPGLGSKTSVDQEVSSLVNEGRVRCVKLGRLLVTPNSTVIFSIDSFANYAMEKNPGCKVTRKFIDLAKRNPSYTYSTIDLSEFSEDEIKLLVQQGLLASDRQVGRWLLSIPSAGMFIRIHELGRKVLTKTIKSTKFREIMAQELKQRKLPAECRFDFRYYLTDLIGSGDVNSISTPAGLLLRLP